MVLPANLLERLPAQFRLGEPALRGASATLALGYPELDSLLPDGGLPRGAVVELAVAGGLALATSVSLAACRAVLEEAIAHGGEAPWCAFVDPSETLYGPGVVGAGVRLDRLLVVRPKREALERTAIRLVESHAFSVVVIDTVGVPGAGIDVSLGAWPRVTRRLSLAVEESGAMVLLVTDGEARRPLPLPVALRIELLRPTERRLSVRIAKERRGRVSQPRTIAWTRPRAKALGILEKNERSHELSHRTRA